MFPPPDDCLHFGFCSVCEQRYCYMTYFCSFASSIRQFQIWKTTPLSPLNTLPAHISQLVVALLPGLKIVSGGKGGMFLFEMLSLPGKGTAGLIISSNCSVAL